MAESRLTFTEWLPDQPGSVGALTLAENVYPKAIGYGPFPEEEDYSQAASENLVSVVAAKNNTGTTSIFAASPTILYLLDSADLSLDNVSGTTYDQAERWYFTQFGNTLIAAGSPNTLQAYDLTTTGTFDVLDAGAPKAKYVTVVRDFVVTGNQPTYPTRVQWSGINDPTTWTSSAVTQSDFQDLPDGGEVRGVTGGEFGLVLCERSIYRMSYVGTPLVFQFDNISRNLGCYEGNSVVQWQGITYFLADDGFYACDGQQVVPIGAEKVNRYFYTRLLEAQIQNMSAAVDPERNLIVWGYPVLDNTYELLVYHIVTKRWSVVESSVSRIASSSTPAVNLEGLDAYSASIDALGTSLDSRIWLGGKLSLAGVSGTKIITFSGASKTAVIETPDVGDGKQTMVTLVKPYVDGGSASVAVASRQTLATTPSFGSLADASSENRVALRSVGKYHRFRVVPSGEWETAIAIDVDTSPAGMR